MSSIVTSTTSVDKVITPLFKNNSRISKLSFFLKIFIENNSRIFSESLWLIFLDLQLSIKSNLITLPIFSFLTLFSLFVLSIVNINTLLFFKYFISDCFTLAWEHRAEMMLNSSGLWAMTFL